MADREHAEWAANQKARKDAQKARRKKTPIAPPPPEDEPRKEPPPDSGATLPTLGL